MDVRAGVPEALFQHGQGSLSGEHLQQGGAVEELGWPPRTGQAGQAWCLLTGSLHLCLGGGLWDHGLVGVSRRVVDQHALGILVNKYLRHTSMLV